MNRMVPLVIIVGGVGLAAGFWLRGAPQVAPVSVEDTKAQLIQAAMKPAAGEKIAHTFADQTAMQAFVDLWQQRQQRALRMTLLEGYWNNENATLGELNTQLISRYGLDLSKSHALNTDERVLIERPAPAASADEAAAPAEASAEGTAAGDVSVPGAAEEQKVVYTFADDAATQAFVQLWQQRQSIVVRMAVLKAYWDSEQQLVAQLNQTLGTEYGVDVAKAYTLDNQRLVLIEREASPAPQPPEAASTAP